MNKLSLTCLVALAALVTGCRTMNTSSNWRRGEMASSANWFLTAPMERAATASPHHRGFPSNELAATTTLYPPGAVTRVGETYALEGESAGLMPGDVGGAGPYKLFAIRSGNAGFYSERFRLK